MKPTPPTVSTLAAVALLAITPACSATSRPTSNPPPSTASSGSTANPYAALASVPSLSVTSASVRDGQPFAAAQLSGIFGVPGGKDESPQLSWTAGPSGTKSYVVTMYDVDAPTGSGFWHWTVYDIPATIHQLAAGAGTPGSVTLPAGAIQAPDDASLPRYLGAAPPKGAATHHFHLTVTAIDVPRLAIAPSTSPALVGFTISTHTLARGHIIATATTK